MYFYILLQFNIVNYVKLTYLHFSVDEKTEVWYDL